MYPYGINFAFLAYALAILAVAYVAYTKRAPQWQPAMPAMRASGVAPLQAQPMFMQAAVVNVSDRDERFTPAWTKADNRALAAALRENGLGWMTSDVERWERAQVCAKAWGIPSAMSHLTYMVNSGQITRPAAPAPAYSTSTMVADFVSVAKIAHAIDADVRSLLNVPVMNNPCHGFVANKDNTVRPCKRHARHSNKFCCDAHANTATERTATWTAQ